MLTIDDVIKIEHSPAHYKTIYPFSVTLHFPGGHRPTPAELATLNSAIVNASAKIRSMRGNAECNFAWCEGDKIHWEREGFSPSLEKNKQDKALDKPTS